MKTQTRFHKLMAWLLTLAMLMTFIPSFTLGVSATTASGTYTVTVTNDGNGTATASVTSGVSGTEVTLSATPNTDYKFKGWQVDSGGVTVSDNKFTIGTADVEIKAIFEKIEYVTINIQSPRGMNDEIKIDSALTVGDLKARVATLANVTFGGDSEYRLFGENLSYPNSKLDDDTKVLKDIGFANGQTVHLEKSTNWDASGNELIKIFGLTITGGKGSQEPYGDYSNVDYYWNYYHKTITIRSDAAITISGTGEHNTNVIIKSAGSGKYTNLTISDLSLTTDAGACINVQGNSWVKLTVKGNNTLTATGDAAQYTVDKVPALTLTNSGAYLKIMSTSTGTLTATTNIEGQPGIGTYDNTSSVWGVEINGGSIIANGGERAAGIRAQAVCIYGGNVTANGGVDGYGTNALYPYSIEILGGTIVASSEDGKALSAVPNLDSYNYYKAIASVNADGSNAAQYDNTANDIYKYFKIEPREAYTFTIDVSASSTEGGTVTGGGTYEENTSVTVSATANDGYRFVKWTENGSEVSTDASYTFTANANRTLVAEFAKLYTVTFNANNGTNETDSESVTDGSSLTLTNDVFTYGKCEIESWNTQADGSGVIYYIGDNITVTEDVTLYAQWVLPLNKYDSFTDGDYEWSGNGSSPYSFAMKNGAVLYARVIFPSATNDDKTTITVDDDCEIKGSLSFVSGTGLSGGNHRGDLTIKGDGTLKFYEMSSTGSGDTLTVETDVTIVSNYMFIGASGGEYSKIVIKDATLTLHDLTLLQYLTMEGEAKLNIISGTASFHTSPAINLSDESEIYIGGDGYGCVLYKEGENEKIAFDALVSNGWLPAGYSFKEYNSGYYLYDEEDNLETGAITIKKQQYSGIPLGGGGGTTRYTVQFDTDGGSKVDSQRLRRNAKVAEPAVPTKEGCTFDGWYIDKELTSAYDFSKAVTKGFTLYAKWVEDTAGDISDDSHNTDAHKCPSREFDDLDITQWYHYDTDYVLENGIFKGVSEKIFEPDSAQTRAMMVTVLYRAEGEPATNRSIPFADIDMSAYYANAVIWAQQNGIVKGISETEFAPDDSITREQIAAIMYRYAQYKGYDISVGENTNILSYDDFAQISEYAITAMQWAVGSGIIKGKSASTLNPQDFATRAEIAAMLHRFIEANK